MEFVSRDFDPSLLHARFTLNCDAFSSMHDLFYGLYELLRLPDYFWSGNRWDSLNDCLLDLSWIHAESIVLRFEGFLTLQARLPKGEQADARALLDALRFVALHAHEVQPARKRLQFVIT